MKYQELIDSLLIDMNAENVCKVFYKKVRETLPDKIYKYYSLNENKKLNSSKLRCLQNRKVYVSSRKEFNDPYDDFGYIYDRDSIITYAESLGMQWILNDIHPDFKAICCFTKSGNDNFAMWAHYANNHQGYCVEYDLRKNFKLCSLILPVEYVDKKMDLTEMIKGRLKFVKNNKDVKLLEDALEFCAIFMSCVKHKTWSYEEEIRLLCPKNLPGMPYFDAIPNKIFIGSKCSENNTNCLIQIGNNLNIDVYKMNVVKEKLEYELDSELLHRMNV